MALIQVDFFSASLMRTVTINAVIPVDKMTFTNEKREKKPFKTLYLLHGIFGNYTDWITGTRIQSWAQDNNLAVIMPSGENKFYLDNEKTGEMYGKFIGEELVNITRDLFPLSTKKEDTFIGGLSMGGYGAIVNGLHYPEIFGYICGLSSALIIDRVLQTKDDSSPFPTDRRSYNESIFGDLDKLKGSDKNYYTLIEKLKVANQTIPAFYLACGTEDSLLPENRAYHDFLVKQGVNVTYEEGPGGHDWKFWDEYIYKVLQWLPLEEKTESIHSGHVNID